MTRLLRLPLLILLVMGLVVAACGDDDDSSSTDQSSDQSDDGSGTAGDDSGDDGSAAAVGGDCGFLVDFAGAFEGIGDPTAELQSGQALDFGKLYSGVADATEQMADNAPSEIEDAFKVIADAFRTVADELDGVTLDFSDPQNIDPEALAAFDQLDSAFGDDFNAAAEEVDAWITANCSDLAGELDLGNLESLGS